jgi:hypothetical protein
MLELLSTDLAGKIFWNTFRYGPGAGASVSFLYFTLVYARPDIKHRNLICAAVSVVWIFLLAFAFAHPPARARLVPYGPFTALLYDFGDRDWIISG